MYYLNPIDKSEGYEDFEDFVTEIILLCEREASPEEFLELIVKGLKGDIAAGEINTLVERFQYDKFKEQVESEFREDIYEEFEEKYKKKLEKNEAQLKLKYKKMEEEVELGVIYEIFENKFLKEEGFLEYCVEKLKADLLASKEEKVFPYLYEETLARIDHRDIIRFLMENSKDELLGLLKEEIKDALFSEDPKELIGEFFTDIKREILEDREFVEKVRKIAARDVAKRIFE